ncbi:4'-phosphopantetheinyl transferase superfamily protein [Bacillus sp. SD075]|uniref:4'-phosphopantetheinyl transferase family protein n=1 Tax=Bacillus sp. SD075 TaxID=2781732 RepID=UPI001A9780D7|nr:4'-phosphopantetheinyl transferase superfamily protein [Bacillus sp. SD075]MBO0999169.1 4'-phosphopantetheinyl transferase superfamily protein [Bacillus sp. SD075]
MVELYICRLPVKKEESDLNKLLVHVSIERQSRIKRLVKLDDAYRSLIGDLMVRFVLKERYGSVKEGLGWRTNSFGKPFLSKYPMFHYNISHSGEYVVCAMHDAEVGVDIEKIGPFDLQLAKGFFTEEEYKQVLEAEDGLSSFYDIWTLKESYIKAIGKGLSIPLHSLNVRRQGMESIQLTDVHSNVPITDFTCRQYMVDSEYRLAVCAYQVSAESFKDQHRSVTFHQICEGLNIILE